MSIGRDRLLPDCGPYCTAHSQAVVRLRRHAHPLKLAIDAAGTSMLCDLYVSFVIATGRVLNLFFNTAPRNSGSVLKRVVDEVWGEVFEQRSWPICPATGRVCNPGCS